jgi:glucose/arabinose dehydrogenase
VSEFRVADQPNVSTTSERVLLVIHDPYPNHNGGMVEFGPEGFLYIALGDGGAGGDPENRGQNLQELLGKLLRIDVDHGTPYTIPPDNPFVASGGRPEIYAWGFRNPWRFSFDRLTGQLWAGDVGQNKWEEIDIVQLGGNYGWRVMEGTHCYDPAIACPTKGLIQPVAEYRNDGTRCSIIGGYVYRGAGAPTLYGTYLYGDFCSGEIFGLRGSAQRTLLAASLSISSFGQDQSGEVYVVGLKGTVHRIVEPTR